MNKFKESFTPMLLKEIQKPFDDENYLFEIKFDGIRAIIYASPKEFIIKSRNEKDITNLFPELKKIQKFIKTPTIFDGEIVSFNKGKPSFSDIQKRIHTKNQKTITLLSHENPVVFIAFDIIYQNKDLSHKPLWKRKEILSKYQDTNEFIKSLVIEKNGQKLFKEIASLNLEGIVAKEKNSLYEKNTRSSKWLKIKNIKTEDFLICGYQEKKGNVFSLILGQKKDNIILYRGKVSLTKKNNLYQLLKKEPPRKTSPLKNYQEKDSIYVTPKYMCEVSFLEKTKDNILRHPVFKRQLKNQKNNL